MYSDRQTARAAHKSKALAPFSTVVTALPGQGEGEAPLPSVEDQRRVGRRGWLLFFFK